MLKNNQLRIDYPHAQAVAEIPISPCRWQLRIRGRITCAIFCGRPEQVCDRAQFTAN